ncbi:LuxR family transcriptional regulator [Frankia sp. AgB32]|uniref:helix-turn-helix transcriptional regulator n=1 Tax=Frankia sp. AgB32 TaxID=631119 RepID=UPI00200CEC50|nr:LuxR family transcriptional regulator [Frankia sp. AgB32]MCK9896244.1 AAA family ATPase [Frankia sp. AgB32]
MRTKERRRLLAALDAVADGAARVAEVSGEPGSGKTRLLGELTRQAARRGLPVVTGRCAPADRDLRFGVFHRLLSIRPAATATHDGDGSLPGALLTALLAGADPDPGAVAAGLDGAAVFDTARLLLDRVAGDGLVLVVDDLHWSDEASIRLVDHLIRWPVDAPLLLVVAHRPRQSAPRLLDAFAHGEDLGTIERIALPPLHLDQAARLTGLDADDPRLRELHQASEGNPRYLLGLASPHLPAAQQLPASRPPGAITAAADSSSADSGAHQLVAPVLAELAELGPECSRVAWAAAVLAEPFDLDTVATVADLEIDPACTAVAALVERDLLRPVHGEAAYRLRHRMLAGLLYTTLDPGWRRAAHRRAASALALAGAPPAVLAVHIERFPRDSGLHEVHMLADAAKESLASAPLDAVRWLRLALRILTIADIADIADGGVDVDGPTRLDRLRGELSLSLAWAFHSAGMPAESRTQIRQTMRLAAGRPATDRAGIASLCAMLAYATGQHADAKAILVAEIDAAIGAPRPGSTESRGPGEPRGAGRPVPPRARPAVIALLLSKAVIGLLDGAPPSPDDLGLMLRLARAEGDRTAEVGALAVRAVVEAFDGDVPAAAMTVTLCIAIADRLPDAALADHPEHLALLGWADSVLGRQLDAERHFSRGAALAHASGRGEVMPLLLSGLSAVYQRVGRLPEARRIAAEMQQLIRHSHRGHHTSLAEAIEALAGVWIDGHGSRRTAALAEAAAVERSTARPAARRSWWADVATIWTAYAAAADGGDPRRTEALILDTGGGESLDLVSPILHPMAFEALAAAAERLGAVEAAVHWAELAEHAADRLGLGYQRGHALAARAHALRGMSQPGSAAQLYQRSADLFAAAGMLSLRTHLLVQSGRCFAAAGQPAEAARQFTVAGDLARRCGASRLARQAQAGLRALERRGQTGDALGALTPRERQIAAAAAKGGTSRQIALDLRLSPRTVDAHLTRIYRKLGVSSRVALVRLAGETGSP